MPTVEGSSTSDKDGWQNAFMDAYKKTNDAIVQQINGGGMAQVCYYYAITAEVADKKPGDDKYVYKFTYDVRPSNIVVGSDHPAAARTALTNNPNRITEAGHIGPDLVNARQPDPEKVFLKCDQYVVATQSRHGANQNEAVTKAFQDAFWQAVGKQCPAQCPDLHVHIWTNYKPNALSGAGPTATWWLKCWCGEEANES
jgi:hypothetical protein